MPASSVRVAGSGRLETSLGKRLRKSLVGSTPAMRSWKSFACTSPALRPVTRRRNTSNFSGRPCSAFCTAKTTAVTVLPPPGTSPSGSSFCALPRSGAGGTGAGAGVGVEGLTPPLRLPLRPFTRTPRLSSVCCGRAEETGAPHCAPPPLPFFGRPRPPPPSVGNAATAEAAARGLPVAAEYPPSLPAMVLPPPDPPLPRVGK